MKYRMQKAEDGDWYWLMKGERRIGITEQHRPYYEAAVEFWAEIERMRSYELNEVKFRLDTTACPRCGEKHKRIGFEELTIPIRESDGTVWTHWGRCPTNGQPILFFGVQPAPKKTTDG